MVFKDEEHNAEGLLYLDDFNTFAYNQGEYLLVNILFEKGKTLRIKILHAPESLDLSKKYWQNIYLFGIEDPSMHQRVRMLQSGFDVPLDCDFGYVEESKCLVVKDIMARVDEEFNLILD